MVAAPGLIASALALALALAPDLAQAKFDPGRRWRAAETPHFVVLFPEGCDDLAARAGAVAEEVHALLAPRIGWEPRARTRLVLSDDTDAAGGWATPYPYNQLLVSAAPAAGEPGFGTTAHDDWLRLVITHEYTHVLQLDQASRLPLGLRSVFGRLYFPNALQPEWLIEGLATFEETELTLGGRGRSPGAEMVLRMATLEGSLPTLGEMAVLPDRWPAGQVPYLFGESFIRHLDHRLGRERVARISRDYGGRPLPFLVGSTGRGALGLGYRELWREWSLSLLERFQAQEARLTARGLTRAAELTQDGRFNGSPAWSPDGTRIAWLRADGRSRPGIWVMSADGSGRRRLCSGAFPSGLTAATLAWSPDGSRLYYAKPGFVRGAAVFDDIWACDSASGREGRITRGLRVRDPHPSPDGRTIALVTTAGGMTRLALLDLAGPLPAAEAARLRYLTEASPEQLAAPRWSPDGTRLALSARLPGGGRVVRILAADGAALDELPQSPSLDGAPAWSPDGRALYLHSDRDGIFNLQAWDTASRELRPLTNVLGGAFSPAPSPDGHRLVFVNYTARGYDLHLLDLVTASALASGPPSTADVPLHPPPKVGTAEAAVTPAERRTSLTASPGLAQGWRAAGAPRRPDRREDGGGAARQDPAATNAEQSPPGIAAPEFVSRPYSPLDTVLPRLWFPWAATSAESGALYGLVTGGQDVLQRHRYLLTGLYGPESGRFMHTLDYAYDGLRPTLRLLSTDFDRTWAGLVRDGAGGSADYSERERTVGVEAALSFPGFERSQTIAAGYRYRHLSALSPPAPLAGSPSGEPTRGSLGAARLSWAWSSARRQTFSISPEGGRTLLLAVERAQEGLGSGRSYTRATADWSEYLPLPWSRHVLQARLFAGGAGGDPPAQGAFALGGDSPGDVSYALDDRWLHLRGYPVNALRGNRALLAGLEYRFPLAEIGRGDDTAPFFLRRLHGALFVDTGAAWEDGGFAAGELRTGIGAEIRLDLYFSYFVPLTLRLGLAKGLDEEGGVYPTLGIWMPQGLPGSATSTRRR